MLDEALDSNPDTGAPIDNYISQYSGNIYLSDFDPRVKEVYHIKHYFRYMDDMVFLSSSKEELQALIKEITKYLVDEYDLKVKDSWSLFRVEDRGIDFVGYVLKHGSIRLRKSIAHSIKKTSSKIRRRINNDMGLNRHLYFSFNSLKGWVKHSHAVWLKTKYFDIVEDYVIEYHDKYLVNKDK